MSEKRRPIVAVLILSGLPALSSAEAAGERLIDPTRPPQPVAVEAAPAAGAAPGLRLQAVFTGPEGEAALINGRLVNPGERVAGALLRQVRTDGVLLERDGESWEMPIGVAAIKQPAGPNRRSSE